MCGHIFDEKMPLIKKDTNPGLFKFMTYFGLFVGCLAKFVTGSLFTFNVYQGDLKEIFNYTQTEVELQSSLLNLGLGIGFIPGVIYDRFGPSWTSCAGLIVSVGSYMLLWSTTKNVAFYRDKSTLMAFYFLLCGLGSAFTYMVALNTNIINLDKKYRGTVVGLLNAFFAGSPSVFAQIYLKVLTGNGTEKYATFMILFAILFGIVDLLCMLFLRIYTDDSHDQTVDVQGKNYAQFTEMNSVQSDIDKNSECCSGDSTSGKDDTDSMTLVQILLNIDYHLFSWMFVFGAAIGLVYLNNLTTVSKSVGLQDKDSTLLILIPVCNASVSLILGFLSDKIKDKIPRMTILLISSLIFSGSLVMVIFGGTAFTVLVIATILCGFGTGMYWTLSPTVMSERFCLKNIGRNWGLTILLAALVGWGIQEVFGHMYDKQTENANGGYCQGLSCVRGGLAVGLGSGILSIILCIIYISKRRIQQYLAQRRANS